MILYDHHWLLNEKLNVMNVKRMEEMDILHTIHIQNQYEIIKLSPCKVRILVCASGTWQPSWFLSYQN